MRFKPTNKFLLAPMEGVNDVAFRLLAQKYGAGYTYTQQLNPLGILHGNEKTTHLLQTSPEEKNIGLQLFGRDSKLILKAWEEYGDHFSLLDINLGCPSKKIVAQGYGSALLQEKQVVKKLVKDISGSISKPLTVKMRSGFKKEEAVAIAKIIEDGGASAVAVHGRTQEQKYSGSADWDVIKRVHQTLSIPVIGNGDITSGKIANHRIERDYSTYVMIGRGAMKDPSIFKKCIEYSKERKEEETTKENKIDLMMEYYNLWKKFKISEAVLKQHFINMSHDFDGAATIRENLVEARTEEEIVNAVQIRVKNEDSRS